ncbi:hypothetical protein GFL28_26720 [Rhizobium leguminosarum bv. viciae]|nr:hypothetical protein [Rhizobium leguminosarum]NKK45574.1 hypothetical protein [Rhizobium leguminosarum bv. viciae]
MWRVSRDDKRSSSQDFRKSSLEELSGTDIVGFNLYRLAGAGSIRKPCEMSSILGFDPSPEKAASTIMAEK